MSFDNIELTGAFDVGYKTFHLKQSGNAVSVYYPVDKGTPAGIAEEPVAIDYGMD